MDPRDRTVRVLQESAGNRPVAFLRRTGAVVQLDEQPLMRLVIVFVATDASLPPADFLESAK